MRLARRLLALAGICVAALVLLPHAALAQTPDITDGCIGNDHTPPYRDPATGQVIDAPSVIIVAVSVEFVPEGTLVRVRLIGPDGQEREIRLVIGPDGRAEGAAGIFSFGEYRAGGPILLRYKDPVTGEPRQARIDPIVVILGGVFVVGPQEIPCAASDLPPGSLVVPSEPASPSPSTGSPSPSVVSPSPRPVADGGGVAIWWVVIGGGVTLIVIGGALIVIRRTPAGTEIDIVHPGVGGRGPDTPPTIDQVVDEVIAKDIKDRVGEGRTGKVDWNDVLELFTPKLGERAPDTPRTTPPVTTPTVPPVTLPTTTPETPRFVPPTAGGDIAGPGREVAPPALVDGRTERDNAPCNCGPDVTDMYIEALNRLIGRLRKDVGSLVTWVPGSGIAFLLANGMQMDFKVGKDVGTCANCQRCLNTVTLLGRCVVDHTLNDLIFGICAGYFGVSETIQDLGGHVAEIMAYGSLDSPISQAIYRVGNEFGRRANDDSSFVFDASALGEVLKVAPIRVDCDPCPRKAAKPWADFTSEEWSWPGSETPPKPK